MPEANPGNGRAADFEGAQDLIRLQFRPRRVSVNFQGEIPKNWRQHFLSENARTLGIESEKAAAFYLGGYAVSIINN